ncbi:MAG: hypothetical protein H6733_01780 [Alphaproteobacteria bacterium]|nr:hypothetical protein [Alphaproteobacteria bacterium]
MRGWVALGLLGVLATGCMTPERFTASARRIACERERDCDAAAFFTRYGSRQGCLDGFELFVPHGCEAQWCTFDDRAAGTCLTELRSVSCPPASNLGPEAPTCDDVWRDCDRQALFACYVDEGIDALDAGR